MIERAVGAPAFAKALQTVLQQQQAYQPLTTKRWLHVLKQASSHDLRAFSERWIEGTGFPPMSCGYWFNTKKKLTEFALRFEGRQAALERGGIHGTITVRLNEIRGTYDQTVAFDSVANIFEFQFHTQVRRARRKRMDTHVNMAEITGGALGSTVPSSKIIAAAAGQSLQPVSAGGAGGAMLEPPEKKPSPVLWVRVDPEFDFVHTITLRQPEDMWIAQLEKDKDVRAQIEAINGLTNFPSSKKAGTALGKIVGQAEVFWPVRVAAAHAIARIRGPSASHMGVAFLSSYHQTSVADPTLRSPTSRYSAGPRAFADLPGYHLACEMLIALASARAADGMTPQQAIDNVLANAELRDSTGSAYSDAYLCAAQADALSKLAFRNPQTELPQARDCLLRMLELDGVLPSHNNVCAVAALRALATLLHEEALPLLRAHATPAHPYPVRLAALEGICTVAPTAEFPFLLSVLGSETESHRLRRHLAVFMRRKVLRKAYDTFRIPHDATAAGAANQLYEIINSRASACDSRLRCSLVDLYIYVWGHGTPAPLWTDNNPWLSVPSLSHEGESSGIFDATATVASLTSPPFEGGLKRKLEEEGPTQQVFVPHRGVTPSRTPSRTITPAVTLKARVAGTAIKRPSSRHIAEAAPAPTVSVSAPFLFSDEDQHLKQQQQKQQQPGVSMEAPAPTAATVSSHKVSVKIKLPGQHHD